MMNFRKCRAKDALEKANYNEDAYVVIILDKFDSYHKYCYVKKWENLNDYLAIELRNSTLFVDEVYNLSLDIESQLEEKRSYHIERFVKEEKQINEVPIDNELKNKAYNFARRKHQGQYRKFGNVPYINHPENVAKLILKYKGDSKGINDLLCAAYLHDTLEDTDTSFKELIENFNVEIAYLVKELTTDINLKKEIGKEKYLSYKLSEMSDWALDLKLCDRLDNISDLDKADDEFKTKYFFETIHVIDYVLNNRKLTSTQKNIITDIMEVLNKLEMNPKKLMKSFN